MIGPTFGKELEKAGLAGLPFSWGDDGSIQFSASMTKAQKDGVLAVLALHNPDAKLPVPELEEMPKDLRALALIIADLTGKSTEEVKVAFKNAWGRV